jgi:RND family efflux transporter MFP subunit
MNLKSGFASSGVLLAALAMAVLASGCSKVVRGNAGASAAPPTVAVAEAESRPLARHLTVSSELVPFQEIDVYAKEAGYVKQLSVDYGSRVRAGQVMAVLEIPELEAQLQQDQAVIRARNDEVKRAQDEVARAKAQYDIAELQYNRLAGVAKTKPGLVAQQEVDDAQAKSLAAGANMDAIRGTLEAARSEVAVAQAKLAHDQDLYNYSKITAPFDGVVTQRFANLGALMQAGTSSTQATPLVRLSQENVFRLVIPVPESYVKYIRIGDPIQVKVPSLDITVTGKVARISSDVNSNTRTMHTEVNVPNPKGRLVPGMYAEAELTLGQSDNATVIPVQAIDRDGEQTSVMLLEEGNRVGLRPVTLGVQTANYAEIASGLAPGDRVVVSDRSGLKAGEVVAPHPAESLAYDGTGAVGAQ